MKSANDGHAAWWAALSPEEKVAHMMPAKDGRAAWWAALSPEQKQAHMKSANDGHAAWWAALSPEEKVAHMMPARVGFQAMLSDPDRYTEWLFKVKSATSTPIRTVEVDLGGDLGNVTLGLCGWEHRYVDGLLPIVAEALQAQGLKGAGDGPISLDDFGTWRHDYYMIVQDTATIRHVAEHKNDYARFYALRTQLVNYKYRGQTRPHRLDHSITYRQDIPPQLKLKLRLALYFLENEDQYQDLVISRMAGLPADAPARRRVLEPDADGRGAGGGGGGGGGGEGDDKPPLPPDDGDAEDGDVEETKCSFRAVQSVDGIPILLAKAVGTAAKLKRPYLVRMWCQRSAVTAIAVEVRDPRQTSPAQEALYALEPVSILLDADNPDASKHNHNT
jgi:hypothetical protein